MTSPATPATRAITALAGARRAVQLYPPAHPAYGEALAELERAVQEAAAAEPFVLNLHQGRLYHGSLPIPDDVPGLPTVMESFESLEIESLVFQPQFNSEDASGLTEVLSLRDAADLDLSAELAARGVNWVLVSLLARAGFAVPDVPRRTAQRSDRAVLQQSVAALRDVFERVSAGELAAASDAVSLARRLAPEFEADPASFISQAVSAGSKDRSVLHSLNVSVYATMIGHRLGLSALELASLTTAAMLHDIGKSAFDPADPTQAQHAEAEHPSTGVEMLRHLALDDAAPLVVAWEHHMYADGTGFPERAPGYIAHPYSRIVSIANRFDNLTNPQPGARGLTPDRALVQVLRESSAYFDPFFARLFASVLGPFPVGCVVRLTDQSVGVVQRVGSDPLAPVVRLVFDDRGLDAGAGTLDLAESAEKIVEVVAPESLGIDLSSLL